MLILLETNLTAQNSQIKGDSYLCRNTLATYTYTSYSDPIKVIWYVSEDGGDYVLKNEGLRMSHLFNSSKLDVKCLATYSYLDCNFLGICKRKKYDKEYFFTTTAHNKNIITSGSLLEDKNYCLSDIKNLTLGSYTNSYGTIKNQLQENLGTDWVDISLNQFYINYKFDISYANTSRQYRVAATDDCKQTTYSNPVNITVYSSINAGIIQSSQNINYGELAKKITSIEKASGGNGSITYEWEINKNGAWESANIYTETFDPGYLTETTEYRRKASNTCGDATSNRCTVTVSRPGDIAFEQTILNNTSPNIIVGTPAELPGTILYQWQDSDDGITFNNVIGSESKGVSFTPKEKLIKDKYYQRTAKAGSSPKIYTSNIHKVTVLPAITGNLVIAGAENAKYGSYIKQNLTISELPSIENNRPEITYYKWIIRYGDIGENGYEGVLSNTINPVAFNTNGLNYPVTNNIYLKLVCSVGDDLNNPLTLITSNELIIKAEFDPGNIYPYDDGTCNTKYICPNSTAFINGDELNYPDIFPANYVWEMSDNGINNWIRTNHSGYNYISPVLDKTTFFRRILIINDLEFSSNICSVNVAQTPDIIISDNQTVLYNEYPEPIMIDANPFNPYSVDYSFNNLGVITYMALWNSSVDAINFGAEKLIVSPNKIDDFIFDDELTNEKFYNLSVNYKVGGQTCKTVTSNTVKITVEFLPGHIDTNQKIAFSSRPNILIGGMPLSGNTKEKFTYQWEQNDGIKWSDIPLAESVNYQPGQLIKDTYFRRKDISSFGKTKNTNTVLITVLPEIKGDLIIGESELKCANEYSNPLTIVNMPLNIEGVYTYIERMLKYSADGKNFTIVNTGDVWSSTGYLYTPFSSWKSGFYQMKIFFREDITSPDAVSGHIYSNIIEIKNYPVLVDGGFIESDQTVTSNIIPDVLTFNKLPDGGSGNYFYQWQISYTSNNFQDIKNANTVTYQPDKSALNRYYRVSVKDECGYNAHTNNINLKTVTALNPGSIAYNGDIPSCGDEYIENTLSHTGGIGIKTYVWEISYDGKTYSEISGATLHYYMCREQFSAFYRRGSVTEKEKVYTNPVYINRIDESVSIRIGNSQTICENDNIETIEVIQKPKFTYVRYVWEMSYDKINWINTGNCNINYLYSLTTDKTKFIRYKALTNCGKTFISDTIEVKVTPSINVGYISPDIQNVCNNSDPSILTVTLPTGGSGLYTYLWEKNISGNWFTVPNNQNKNTYTPQTTGINEKYRVNVSSTNCKNTAISKNTSSVNIYDEIIPRIIYCPSGKKDTLCYNEKPSLIVSPFDPKGGNGKYDYQWEISNNGKTFTEIPGANSNNYQSGNLTQTSYFRLKYINLCGIAYSEIMQFNVLPLVVPGDILNNQNVCSKEIPQLLTGEKPEGGNKTYTYRWEYSFDGISYYQSQNADKEVYQPLTSNKKTYYKRYVQSFGCGFVSSNTVVIDVEPELIPGKIASNQLIPFKSVPSEIIGTSAAGGNGIYKYQWQNSENGVDYFNITGETNESIQPEPLKITTYFRRVVYSSTCAPEYSNTVTITVFDKLYAGTIELENPNNKNVCYNSSAGKIKTIVPPLGGSGAYIYQWQTSNNGINYIDAVASEDEIIINNLQQKKFIRKKIIAPISEDTAYTNVVTVSVKEKLSTEAIVSKETICYGTRPQIIYGGNTSGGSGIYSYQWQSSDNNTDFSDMLNENKYEISLGNLQKSTYYRRKTIDECGSIVTNSSYIEVTPPLNPGKILSINPTCANVIGDKIEATAAVGGSGIYSYKWYFSYDSITYYTLSDIESESIYLPNIDTSVFVKRSVSSINCGEKFTEPAKQVILPQLSQGSITDNQTICFNSYPQTIIASAPVSGGNNNYEYLWEISNDYLSWKNLPAEKNDFMFPPKMKETTYIRRSVKSSNCVLKTSNTVKITVRDSLKAAEITDNQIICHNSVPVELFTENVPSGGSGIYSNQWQISDNGISYTDIPDADNINYSPDILTKSKYYRQKTIDLQCGEIISNPVKITVGSKFISGNISDYQTIIAGKPLKTITGTESFGGIGSSIYEWQISEPGLNSWQVVNNQDSKDLLLTDLYNTSEIRRMDINQCGTDSTNIIQITVLPKLLSGKISDNQIICFKTAPELITVTSESGGNGVYKYQWQKSYDLEKWTDLLIASNSLNYQPAVLTESIFYRRRIICPGYDTAFTDAIYIEVKPEFLNPELSNSQLLCSGSQPSPVTIKNNRPENATYQYQVSDNNAIWADIENSTDEYLIPVQAAGKKYYRLIASNTCGIRKSESVSIEYIEKIKAGTIYEDHSIGFNKIPNEITGSSAQNDISDNIVRYKWQMSFDSVNFTYLPLGTDINYQPSKSRNSVLFRRIDIDNCTSDTTNTVTVTVLPKLVEGPLYGSKDLCYGKNNDTLAPGQTSGGNGQYSYQWQKSPDGSEWTNILVNGMSEKYAVKDLVTSSFFRRRAICSIYDTAYTSGFYFNIKNEFLNPVISSNQELCSGKSPAYLFISANQPESGSIFQWQESDNAFAWSDIAGATTEKFQPVQTAGKKYYRVSVDNDCGERISESVSINFIDKIKAGTIFTSDSIVGYGKKPAIITGSLNVSSYQWQQSFDNTLWMSVVDGSQIHYQPSPLTESVSYRRIDIDRCWSDTSNTVNIRTLPKLQDGSISANQKVCLNADAQPITVTSPSGGSGIYSYQWQKSETGTDWNNILIDGISEIYTPVNISAPSFFRRRLNCGIYDTAYSNSAFIDIYPSVTAPVVGYDQVICNKSEAEPVKIVTPPAGAASYTYQWEVSSNNAAWSLIPDQSEDFYNPGYLEASKYYRARAVFECGYITSNSVKVSTYNSMYSGHIEGDQKAEKGSVPAQLTGTAPSGGDEIFTYQYQKSVNGTDWTNIIVNANLKDYQPEPLSDTTYFRRITGNICQTDTSNIVTVSVLSNVTSGNIPLSQTICNNSKPAVIKISVPKGGAGEYFYQYQKSADAANWTDILSANELNYQPGILTDTTYFRRKDSSAYCRPAFSETVAVNVRGELLTPRPKFSAIYCRYSPVTVEISNKKEGYTYNWYDKDGYLESGSVYKISSIEQTDTLSVKAVNELSCNSETAEIILKVDSITADFSIDASVIDLGAAARFIALHDAKSYSWDFYDGDGSSDKAPYHYYNYVLNGAKAQLIVTSENGCRDTVFKSNVLVITGLGKAENNVSVYPTAFNEMLTYNLGSACSAVSITDMRGIELYRFDACGTGNINLGSLQPGYYLLNIETLNQTFKIQKK